jgi:hypothetical protein
VALRSKKREAAGRAGDHKRVDIGMETWFMRPGGHRLGIALIGSAALGIKKEIREGEGERQQRAGG